MRWGGERRAARAPGGGKRAVGESAAAGRPPGARKGIVSAGRPLPRRGQTPVQKGPWQSPVPGRVPPEGSGVESRLPPTPPARRGASRSSSEDSSRAGRSGPDTEGTEHGCRNPAAPARGRRRGALSWRAGTSEARTQAQAGASAMASGLSSLHRTWPESKVTASCSKNLSHVNVVLSYYLANGSSNELPHRRQAEEPGCPGWFLWRALHSY